MECLFQIYNVMYLLDVACGLSVLAHPDICAVQVEVAIGDIEIFNLGKNPPECIRVLERTSQGLDSSKMCQPAITIELSSLGIWSSVIKGSTNDIYIYYTGM